MSAVPYEKICELASPLYFPLEIDGAIYMVSQNGDILKFKDGQFKAEFHISGQPYSIVIDKPNKFIYVADMAHQAILKRYIDENSQEQIVEYLKDYEGQPLLGPNSLLLSTKNNLLFFTDSGPFGETSIENCKGSLFAIDMDAQIVKPLALQCLSYPSGICLSNNQQLLYLCETGKNRVLRFVQTDAGIFYYSTYIQLNGRFGPIACAVSQSEHLYVARFEFGHVSEEGQISIFNANGLNVENVSIPQCPEISGLTFSSQKSNILYVTENSSTPSCLRILINIEEKDEAKKKDKDKFK
ncbi:unnamed protein product (macronuclear) [Paramecium tetraurelia]|uniref:SMP-30/Gluconolactonase/LRE-like region domain-containing protein n=1 Tax=Paramecium tetraurelia TaxID=5888 RepID=A0DX30_PARTE|nr:uncharacterized protein GSPATT00021229001 [Paramecium tetraurelia]CAK87597.1 unnamed protein product [Paramecium tetraurelia]|eukprot:XP_001454994.1 hypothetical protein (macronuclear) [Paramecium tetraurelia strain d4-2]